MSMEKKSKKWPKQQIQGHTSLTIQQIQTSNRLLETFGCPIAQFCRCILQVSPRFFEGSTNPSLEVRPTGHHFPKKGWGKATSFTTILL